MLHRDSRYFRLGLTLLTVIVLSTLFAVTLINLGTVFASVKSVLSIFSFVIYGLVFAYLMNPLMKLIEKLLRRLLSRSNLTERGTKKLCRIVGAIVSLLEKNGKQYLVIVNRSLHDQMDLTITFEPGVLRIRKDGTKVAADKYVDTLMVGPGECEIFEL